MSSNWSAERRLAASKAMARQWKKNRAQMQKASQNPSVIARRVATRKRNLQMKNSMQKEDVIRAEIPLEAIPVEPIKKRGQVKKQAINVTPASEVEFIIDADSKQLLLSLGGFIAPISIKRRMK